MAQENEVPLPISFDDDKEKKNITRGITQVATRTIAESTFSGPTGMQKGAVNQSRFGQQIQQSNKSTFGSYKYPVQIISLELDDAPKQKQKGAEIIVAVEPEIETKVENEKEVRYTNEISSYAVKGQTASQVLSGLTAVLVNYSQDMDIKIDDKQNQIVGIVFVENYFAVKFEINIWSPNKDTTRFELLRTDGDAMATAKFLADIQTQFFIDAKGDDADKQDADNDSNKDKDKDKQEPTMNFVSLSLDATSLDLKELFRELSLPKLPITDDLKDDEDSISKKELDSVNETLINNEMESVDELQFLHEKLKENGAISKDIIDHEQLVKTIISESLKNNDICVVRGCLLILEQLCSDNKIGLLLVEQFALFENLVNLLNHQYALIKNYSVRLLAKLAKQKKWNMDKNAATNIEKLVKQYQKEWETSILGKNGFLNQTMFKSIYEKLAECQ